MSQRAVSACFRCKHWHVSSKKETCDANCAHFTAQIPRVSIISTCPKFEENQKMKLKNDKGKSTAIVPVKQEKEVDTSKPRVFKTNLQSGKGLYGYAYIAAS